jgi:hypothetical protein
VQHTAQKGRRFALVVIQDQSVALTAQSALDVSGQAVLVIDSQARVLGFNKPAQALFAGVEKNVDASQLFSLTGMPQRWWEPGLTGRRKMHIEIGPRVYQVTSSASPLPGEDERLYIISFMPMARAANGDRADVTASTSVSDLSRATQSKSTVVTPP